MADRKRISMIRKVIAWICVIYTVSILAGTVAVAHYKIEHNQPLIGGPK